MFNINKKSGFSLSWVRVLLGSGGIFGSGGVIGIFLTIYFLNPPQNINTGLPTQAVKSLNQTHLDIPLKPFNVFDFEEISDTPEPWISIPESRQYDLKVTNNKDFVRSGSHALCLDVKMQPYLNDIQNEYAGVVNRIVNLSDIKAVAAWVKIPDNEKTRNSTIEARLLVHVINQNGIPVGLNCGNKVLKPGEWNSLFIGLFKETNIPESELKFNGQVSELSITVWSNKTFEDKIYIEDITLYQEAPE
jgi:hypothetical protein